MRPNAASVMAALTILIVAPGGCSRRDATRAGGNVPSAPPAGRAGPATTAGEARPVSAPLDLCAEHGVLEAICTKCRPNLVPVFKAKGDWCAEHGFPESVCPICHPDRGGRPAMDVTGAEPPADGLLLRFKSLEIARQAGIETALAVAGRTDEGVEAPATIVADAANVAVVNASAPGVVRSIRADLGSKVSRGSPLAVIESAEVGELRARYHAAESRLSVADETFRREQALFERGMSASKSIQEARAELESARSDFAAARAALGMIGAEAAPAGEEAGTGRGTDGTYTLRAPIAGVVTRRTATVGTMVDLEEPLFEIVNTAKLWAEIDVPERQALRVRVGQRVSVALDGPGDPPAGKGAAPQAGLAATIAYVAPVVDPHTRTVKVRALLRERDERVRANMFARARIHTADAPAVLVPREAVQEARGAHLVFVRLAEDRYETRRVRVEAWQDGRVALAGGGLKPGERVVTTGSYLLRTETMKEGIGAGCCEVEPPKR